VALAASTTRVKLIATVNPILVHPAPMAKMAATVDDISAGRLGINIVTGAVMAEYSQMGVIPDGYEQNRYAYATEWVQVLKRLWTEPSVTHHGQYFHLEECVSDPKPRQATRPFLVCAGGSEEGLRFTARETDCAFVTGNDVTSLRHVTQRAREIAAEEGTTLEVATPRLIILRDSAPEASDYWDYLLDGADSNS
jgi:pyrimidine oxygenase